MQQPLRRYDMFFDDDARERVKRRHMPIYLLCAQQWRFRDKGLLIRHPNSSYVTTKLYVTSTCGCNNNTIFSKRAILTFLTVVVCSARYPGGGQALVMHAKVAIWRYC